ncbi:MAG: efflux RND transporter periplasmic adaptor subunit [Gammaproteobacteria bacterium]|nr:efflux RND transporter periplasmic adaptor subunit [Gammaproteobacteria bacterium]MBU2478268.1 efflux RND transporter periplasmic adaptor subunit [Gammaproteobacteria bacterium]
MFTSICSISSAAVATQTTLVSVQPLGDLVVQAIREAPASAISLNESRLSAEVTAVIETIPVQVGEVVEAGALLVQLDPRDYELALKRSQAALQSVQARIKLAEFQLKRARELFSKKFASEDTLIQRETELTVLQAELASAQIQVDSARRDLEKCRITAPFRAIINDRIGQQGELATPGTPLLSVIDVAHIEIAAQVQPKDGVLLESAEAITFAAPHQDYPVRLLRLSPAIDSATRTREARLAFMGDSAAPGTEGRIVWQAMESLLPADLISRRNGKLGVFVAEQDKARFIVLEKAQEGRPVSVALPVDTRIILDGRFGLQDGQDISLKP